MRLGAQLMAALLQRPSACAPQCRRHRSVGTLNPEQYYLPFSWLWTPLPKQGWARYDEKVDLWSLGVVVFEIWHPFSTGA